METLSYIKRNYPIATSKQLETLIILKSDEVFIEEERDKDVVVLTQVIDRLEKGDCLVLYSVRVLLVVPKPIEWLIQLAKKNIRLITIQEKIATDSDQHYFARSIELLQLNQMCKAEQIKRGVELRRGNGGKIGRPSISQKKIEEIQYLHFKKKMSYRKIALTSSVSLGTVHKYVNGENNDR